MDYKSNSNVVYSCKYHVVWCPKYRRKVLVSPIASRLKELILRAVSEIQADIIEMEIMRQLEYKSLWYGKALVKVDRFYASSQTCSECGYKNAGTKDLAIREWICPNCGVHHDRDMNAAKNILEEGLRIVNQSVA